jgi:hypothetical protein
VLSLRALFGLLLSMLTMLTPRSYVLIPGLGKDFPQEDEEKPKQVSKPETTLRWPKLAPLKLIIPDRITVTTVAELTTPEPGSPVKEYVEFYEKRHSRTTSSDSMFPDFDD